jgi:hypothetical protein
VVARLQVLVAIAELVQMWLPTDTREIMLTRSACHVPNHRHQAANPHTSIYSIPSIATISSCNFLLTHNDERHTPPLGPPRHLLHPRSSTCMITSNTNQPCPNRLSVAQSCARAAHLVSTGTEGDFQRHQAGLARFVERGPV